jgi:DNA-directed RNA polymerase subunit RPC12/RpoP
MSRIESETLVCPDCGSADVVVLAAYNPKVDGGTGWLPGRGECLRCGSEFKYWFTEEPDEGGAT